MVKVKLLIIPLSKKNTEKKIKKLVNTLKFLIDYSKSKKIKLSFDESLLEIKRY